jgi:hypothetical protein
VSLEILMSDQSGLQLDADCYTQAQNRWFGSLFGRTAAVDSGPEFTSYLGFY